VLNTYGTRFASAYMIQTLITRYRRCSGGEPQTLT
jgi:hypothetical protein